MEIRPGDFFATSGRGPVSRFVQLGTLSRYSHVGCFYSESLVVEATQLRGFTGVVKHPLDDLEDYGGGLYYLRMIDNLHEDLDIGLLQNYLDSLVGVKYDMQQALLSGIDWFWFKRFKRGFDKQKLFCSELATMLLRDHQLISDLVNPSDITPKEFVQMPIWASITKFKIVGGEIVCLD